MVVEGSPPVAASRLVIDYAGALILHTDTGRTVAGGEHQYRVSGHERDSAHYALPLIDQGNTAIKWRMAGSDGLR